MRTFVIRRILWIVPTLLGILLLVSLMLEIIPGDPVSIMLAETASSELRITVTKRLGLDKPFINRYVNYLFSIMRGDLGRSFLRGEEVSTLIKGAFPATVELAVAATFLTVVIGLPLGVVSALRPHSALDAASQLISMVGISMPAFWIGLLLIYLFAYRWGLLPLGGKNGLLSLVLPALSISLASLGFIVRIVRARMLEILNREFITAARAKGLREYVVIWKHGLRNAALPILTVLSLQLGRLLGGAVVTEIVFSWPGMGRLVVNAILERDYPLVQGSVLIFGFAFVCINLLIDISYSFMDPRVRY